jgi:hypothetical protein
LEKEDEDTPNSCDGAPSKLRRHSGLKYNRPYEVLMGIQEAKEFMHFGAYLGSLGYRHHEERFLSYIQDAIIEPVITRDILSQYVSPWA